MVQGLELRSAIALGGAVPPFKLDGTRYHAECLVYEQLTQTYTVGGRPMPTR